MKVVYALRRDAEQKPGGDSGKALKYVSLLRQQGIDASVVYGVEDLDEDLDVLHLMNLDLPIENIRYAEWGRKLGKPIVLSTIHHPAKGQDGYYQYGDDPFFARLRQVKIRSRKGIGLREAIKLTVRDGDIAVTLHALQGDWIQAQQRLLDLTTVALPMADSERVALRQDGLHIADTRIVPNGLTFGAAPLESVGNRAGIISVGRIEPRKNQLRLVQVLGPLQIPITLVGPANSRHRQYVRAFQETVNRFPNVTYLGGLPQAELGELYRTHRLHASASWFEVVSQADLEAASNGCSILATDEGYTRDYFASGLTEMSPRAWLNEPEWVRNIAAGLYDNEPIPLLHQNMQYTWEEVTELLRQVYSSL